VFGSVSKSGALFIVSLQLINVGSSDVEKIATETGKAGSGDLTTPVRGAARKLLGESAPPPPPGVAPSGVAPSGAPPATAGGASQMGPPPEGSYKEKLAEYKRIFLRLTIKKGKEERAFKRNRVYVTEIKTGNPGFTKLYASVAVDAPKEKIWKLLTDVRHYYEFMPGYRKCTVLQQSPVRVLMQSKMQIGLMSTRNKEEFLFDPASLELYRKILSYQIDMVGRVDAFAEASQQLTGIRIKSLEGDRVKVEAVHQWIMGGTFGGIANIGFKSEMKKIMKKQSKAIKKFSEI